MTIVINDAADVKDFLWRWLGLDRRSIIFHSIEAGDERPHVSGGIVARQDDLLNSDAFDELCQEQCNAREIEVCDVMTYMIGDGESDSADPSDCQILVQLSEEHPIAFADFLAEYADDLFTFAPKGLVPNPAYEGGDEE